jgi:intracellular sulfur oxidation DsrE/DsrF family protein
MKRLFAIIVVALVCVGFTMHREHPYLVVFDLTSRDSLDQKAVMRWVKEVSTTSPDAKIEVVMYGKGFELVLPERSTVSAEVQQAIKNPNVSFRVCAVSLRNNNIDKSQLLPGVETVPDGLRELVTKQQEGWGYIKVGH